MPAEKESAMLQKVARKIAYRMLVDLPPLSAEDCEGLRASIAVSGVVVPIVVWPKGKTTYIVDGSHRKKIADELGYECPELVRSDLTEEEARIMARALNLARRQLDREQKRSVIADQLQETPERSARWIAKMLGVSDHTVRTVRDELRSGAQIAHLDKIVGQDGRCYPSLALGTAGENGITARAIAGSGDHRRAKDVYPTPTWAIASLLAVENFEGLTWEPAEGDGRIVRALRRAGCKVFGSDLATGTDFLESHRIVDNVVTNPPWGKKTEFIRHANECARRKVTMLLPLSALSGRARRPLFEDAAFPLRAVYVFDRRLNFHPDSQGSSTITGGWFLWERGCRREPVLKWI
jgi:hypothetical protein